MNIQRIIDLFEQMYSERWAYVLGSAKSGCVDCSGAFVYAFKRLGLGDVSHSSNAIYYEHKIIGDITTEPRAGYAALKVVNWTDSADDQKNRWFKAGKPKNARHIGLVDESGKYVLNASSPSRGFCRDKASGYNAFAPLIAFSYDEEDEEMEVLYKATVNVTSGSLNVRAGASTGALTIGKISKVSTVDVLEERGDWLKIKCGDLTGYAASRYLQRVYEDNGGVQLLRQYIMSVYSDGGIAFAEYWSGGDSVGDD